MSGGDLVPPGGSFQVCSPGQAAWVLGAGARPPDGTGQVSKADSPAVFVGHLLACPLPAWLPGAVVVGPSQTP